MIESVNRLGLVVKESVIGAHPLAKKRRIVLIVLPILMFVTCIASLMIGQVSFNLEQIWNGLFNSEASLERRIIWDLRLPRVLIGVMVEH